MSTARRRARGVPRDSAKFRLDWDFARAWSAGLDLRAYSDQYARGDENNADRNGPVPGYAVRDTDLRWTPLPALQLSLAVDNLLDRRYQTLGVLGSNVFGGPWRGYGAAGTSQFRTPRAPR